LVFGGGVVVVFGFVFLSVLGFYFCGGGSGLSFIFGGSVGLVIVLFFVVCCKATQFFCPFFFFFLPLFSSAVGSRFVFYVATYKPIFTSITDVLFYSKAVKVLPLFSFSFLPLFRLLLAVGFGFKFFMD
jgi:hypothetical protein